MNQWAMDHTMTMAGATPILAMDMYEHAYAMDYGSQGRRLCGRHHGDLQLDPGGRDFRQSDGLICGSSRRRAGCVSKSSEKCAISRHDRRN